MRQAWQDAWRAPSFRAALGAAMLLSIPLAFTHRAFFRYISGRPGVIPPDPLIVHLGSADRSLVIFTIMYASIAFTVARALPRPFLLIRGMHAYILLLLVRMVAMWACTLEPPADAIPLNDPLTDLFYPDGAPFLKDLFFSGHTATMALLVPLSRGVAARVIMVSATILVAVCLVAQHVHWTIDVLAAPIFVLIAWAAGGHSLRLCGVGGKTTGSVAEGG